MSGVPIDDAPSEPLSLPVRIPAPLAAALAGLPTQPRRATGAAIAGQESS